MKSSRRPNSDLVLRVFLETRDGRSPEYVICEPTANRRFVDTCRRLGATESEFDLNFQLLNARKQGKLTGQASARRKPKGSATIQESVENAVRFLERQFSTTVDRILCDPRMREEFDSLMQLLEPGCPELEARYAALTLRKKGMLRPELIGRVVQSIGGRLIPVTELRLDDVPKEPGAYLFFDHENTLYAGKAENLQNRIADHMDTWLARDLIKQIRDHRRTPVFLVMHLLRPGIASLSLGAYEAEIIRSRNPAHNLAGKSK